MSSASSSLAGNAGKQFYGTGRRRESIARVYIKMGPARFTVNGRPVDEYFRNIAWHTAAVEPLKFTQMLDQLEVKCIVKGGGVGGQSGAVRMGLSRALSRINPGAAACVAQERFLDARFAHEGTQEVRTKGSASPLPVQQALIFKGSARFVGPDQIHGREGPAKKDAAPIRRGEKASL